MTRLEIVSDPVCPWCYLGAANLMRAVARPTTPTPSPSSWRPYQLDPAIPPEGRDRAAHMAGEVPRPRPPRRSPRPADRRWAPSAASPSASTASAAPRTRSTPTASSAGPSPKACRPAPRWRSSAATSSRARTSPTPTVLSRRRRGGRPRRRGGRHACSPATPTATEIEAEARDAARAMGVTGVPTFLLGGRYAVSGAQPPGLWLRLAAEIDAAADPT